MESVDVSCLSFCVVVSFKRELFSFTSRESLKTSKPVMFVDVGCCKDARESIGYM